MATTNYYAPLISPTILKTLISEINNNISDDYIMTTIEMEQKKNIRPLLGYSFYNQIQEQYTGGTLTTANTIIYEDYVRVILAYLVYKRLINTMTYQLENSGLRKKYSDVSEVAEPNELVYIRKEIQDDIDYYKKEMVKYLCENSSSYPLYINDTDDRYNSLDNARAKGFSFGWNISKI
jgi:hypothetical protein